MRIWERYMFREVMMTWLMLLGGIYFLFVLIDYSNHAQNFHKSGVSLYQLLTYYTLQISKHWELMASFSLLLAVVRTLTHMNVRNEFVALFTSGITRKRVMRPLLLAGLICTASIAINFEWVRPYNMQELRRLQDATIKSKKAERRRSQVSGYTLTDGSTLIYQSYDAAAQRFFDIYWLPGGDEVYRMKYLYPDTETSVAKYVDRLARDDSGHFRVLESLEAKTFPHLRFTEDDLRQTLFAPEHWPPSMLLRYLPQGRSVDELNDRETQILAAFHQKLALPLLGLLVVFAPAPFCMGFSRRMPVFMLFGLAILGFILFLMFYNAMVVLAEGALMAPLFAVWAPFALYGGLFGRSFHRMD